MFHKGSERSYITTQNVNAPLVVEHWTSSLPLHACWGAMGVFSSSLHVFYRPEEDQWAWPPGCPVGGNAGVSGTGINTTIYPVPLLATTLELCLYTWQKVKHASSWCWTLPGLSRVSNPVGDIHGQDLSCDEASVWLRNLRPGPLFFCRWNGCSVEVLHDILFQPQHRNVCMRNNALAV